MGQTALLMGIGFAQPARKRRKGKAMICIGKTNKDFDRRQNAFDLLEEGLKNISDAWTCLFEASKWSVYFEPDEQNIRDITDDLIKLESKLAKIVKQYRA